jgi:hypothetical protein
MKRIGDFDRSGGRAGRAHRNTLDAQRIGPVPRCGRTSAKFPEPSVAIEFLGENHPVQPRPTAAELLAVVAELLDRDVVPALEGPVQHHARVAASLVAIVERQLRLAPAAEAVELAGTQRLLAAGGHAGEATATAADLDEARALLATALRAGMADDPAMASSVWEMLMRVARDDLSISKPGHDSWDGE